MSTRASGSQSRGEIRRRYILIVGWPGIWVPILLLALSSCVSSTQLAKKHDATLADVAYSEGLLQYVLDRSTTSVQFNVGSTKGRFEAADARMTFGSREVENGVLEVTLATGSINLFNPLIEQMLKGEGWFDVANFPLARFTTEELEVIGETMLQVAGLLQIRDTSRPITLAVELHGGIPDLDAAPDEIIFTATGSFSRAGFGMDDLQSMAPDLVELRVEGKFVRDGEQ